MIKNLQKLFSLVFVCCILLGANTTYGQTFYEPFNGTGSIIGNGWTIHSPVTPSGDIVKVEGSLSYAQLIASEGNKMLLPGNTVSPNDVNAPTNLPDNATEAYYSALINVIDRSFLGTSPDYFMHFGGTAGTSVSNFFARLQIKSVNSGENFRLGIQNISGTGATTTDLEQDLDFGTTYFVVVKYIKNRVSATEGTNDEAILWVNPVGQEPTTGRVTNASGPGVAIALKSIALRNAPNTPKAYIDEIRVGATWESVAPQATTNTPTITLTPTSLAPFTTTVGTASDLQTYTVSGQNLTGNVVVSAPEHMEIRLGAEGAYSNELTLTPVNNTLEGSRIQVRIAATAPVGAISGNITHVSEGSNNPSIAVTGSVNALTPTLTVTGTLTTFTTTTGTASATQSYTVGGTNLTGNVVIEAPAGMELRVGTTGNWSTTLTLTPENNGLATTTVQVRIAANAAVGSIAGNITHVSENSNNPSIAVTGTVAVPAPTISRTGAINPFVALVSKASGIQTYTVSGQNLTSDIVVTAPQGYEVRQGAEGTWGNTVTLTPQSGTVANTGVQVRMVAASVTGTVAGNLTIASEGVTAVSAALTGTVVNIVPLSQVKAINAQGQSNIEGEYVVVRGTIHGVNISTAANQHQYTIIDNTDGITIRTISNTVFTGTLAEGDSVEVNGRVETFRGLGQVNLVSRIEKLGQGTIRTPRTVTVLDEATESQLITLRNVTVAREGTSVWANDPASNSATLTGFNVSITTADDVTYLMRITANSPLYGKTYEEVFGTATRVDITGLGGQFATTSAAPFVGGYQIFPYKLTHITAPVTTSLANKMDASQIAVYPNPASDRFVVEASAEGTSTVTVYSITGQRMTSKQFNKSTVIETAGFNSGMYMLHISNGANTVVKKVSVVR
jgi:DNA/RNA endonuclease YhcR with UshA esterase domain